MISNVPYNKPLTKVYLAMGPDKSTWFTVTLVGAIREAFYDVTGRNMHTLHQMMIIIVYVYILYITTYYI